MMQFHWLSILINKIIPRIIQLIKILWYCFANKSSIFNMVSGTPSIEIKLDNQIGRKKTKANDRYFSNQRLPIY